jgi:hypothetical protein
MSRKKAVNERNFLFTDKASGGCSDPPYAHLPTPGTGGHVGTVRTRLNCIFSINRGKCLMVEYSSLFLYPAGIRFIEPLLIGLDKSSPYKTPIY